MTARVPTLHPVLAAIAAAPEGEPLTLEQETDVAAAEREIASGTRGVPHVEIERQIEARRRAEVG